MVKPRAQHVACRLHVGSPSCKETKDSFSIQRVRHGDLREVDPGSWVDFKDRLNGESGGLTTCEARVAAAEISMMIQSGRGTRLWFFLCAVLRAVLQLRCPRCSQSRSSRSPRSRSIAGAMQVLQAPPGGRITTRALRRPLLQRAICAQ